MTTTICIFEGGPLDGQTWELRDAHQIIRIPTIVGFTENDLTVVTHIYHPERWVDDQGQPFVKYVHQEKP